MSEIEAESESPLSIKEEKEIEGNEAEDGENNATLLQNDDAPLESNQISNPEDTVEAHSVPEETSTNTEDLIQEPQIKDSDNPSAEPDVPETASQAESSTEEDSEKPPRKDSQEIPTRKSSNEIPVRKDSKELPGRKDSKEISSRKNSVEESARKDSKEVSSRKNSNEEPARKDSKEVSSRKNSNEEPARKDSKEVSSRKNSNEEPARKDSKEVPSRKDSNEEPARKDSKEVSSRKNSNEEPARKDSKETSSRKSSNEETVRKDSQEDSNIAAIPDAQNIDAERKQSNVSDKGEESKKANADADVDEEIQKMIKELADPMAASSRENDNQQNGNETTENLISVLEDGIDQSKETPQNESKLETSTATTSEAAVKPPKPKKYLYKLKSKTGKILHYTSSIPITLKRPVIHLTKMEDPRFESASKVIDVDKEDVDSDNSSKENNLKENEAPNDNVMPVVKKKGRPPLSSRPPPVITLDGNSSDTQDSFKNKSTPSFSMQTRKRQLKFLPDGRLLPPQKRARTSASSSDSDIDIISSEGEQTDKTASLNKVEVPSKKFKPEIKPTPTPGGEKRKYKKVFDFESYYREKTGVPPPSGLARSQVNRTFTSSLTPVRKIIDTPRPKLISPAPSPAAPKKTSSVDPAQLLSSLIGVPITPNQLNVVKFKPKIIQERTNNVVPSTPKKVTFEDDKTKKLATNQSELLKSTPFKIVSKPTYQKILPKPTGVERQPVMQNRMTYQPVTIDSKFAPAVPSTSLFVAATSPFLRESLNETLSKFETFTDSKVVKTKEGPRKATKRKHTDEEGALKDSSPKTIYDLMYDIFDKMPSWNLHVIPDNNCFCIAQVSRGRMGIPTLKKSIELNSEFFAKVYVHQLHCKRYDGIYDTESKIIKLIREIDALAA